MLLRFNVFKWALLLMCLNIFRIGFTSVKCEDQAEIPLVLLVSFDGFRHDYLEKHNLKNFNLLKSIGSYADFIYNSFVTATFPNHWYVRVFKFFE